MVLTLHRDGGAVKGSETSPIHGLGWIRLCVPHNWKDPLPTPCARHNWTPWRGQGQLWSTMGTCSKISHGLLIGLESGHYRDHVDTLSSLSGPVVAECSVGSLPSTCRRRNLLGKLGQLGLQVVGFEYQVAPSKEMITEMCFSYNFFINSIFLNFKGTDGNWTHDLWFTRPTPCHLATMPCICVFIEV